MKAIDFIVLIPLAYGAYEGYKKGFVLVVVGFLSLIFGIIGAFKLLQLGIDFLMNYFPHIPKLIPFLAFILIFVLIATAVYLLGVAIKKTLQFTIFAGTLDNFAGALVGILQYAFMVSILIWLIKESHLVIPEKYTKNSLIFTYLDDFAPKIVRFFEFLLPFAKDLFGQIKEIF